MRGSSNNQPGRAGQTSSYAAYVAWTEHRFFRYRGCAPDPDRPGRAAGNPELGLDAWVGPDVDGGEPQKERRAREAAAKEVCLNCPVMVACDAYASSVTVDGKLAEPDGVRGGLTALERHRRFIKSRHRLRGVAPAPVEQLRTVQKQAVLRALAAWSDPVDVAFAAGMDVRTANWQVSRLRTQLGLAGTAGRAEILEAARVRGLLEGVRVVPDGERERGRPRVASPSRARFAHVAGQLALWETAPGQLAQPAESAESAAPAAPAAAGGLAVVRDLFPAGSMEAAA